jgi:hypothetical protein
MVTKRKYKPKPKEPELPKEPPPVKDLADLKDKMKDQWWRLNNLYYIKDKDGNKIIFRPNWAQIEMWESMHNKNVVLKARQLGCTTWWCLYFLDCCLFTNKPLNAGIVAHNKEDCEAFFQNKIKYAFDNLPAGLRSVFKAKTDTKRQLSFANYSNIRVGTSLRSSTNQMLLISEFGKICCEDGAKAKEIVTGSLNTVSEDNLTVIESTAEGTDNYFHRYCITAMTNQRSGKQISKMDWQFFFFPWWKESSYCLQDSSVYIGEDMKMYFAELHAHHQIRLSPEQKSWYIKKWEDLGDDMFREYPSTPEEAFAVSNEGKYYSKQIIDLVDKGQVLDFTIDPLLEVHSAWDLGFSDMMSLIFYQRHGPQIRIIDYYENANEPLSHYVGVIKRKYAENDWNMGDHWLPHDAAVHELQTGKSRVDNLNDLGLNVYVAERRHIAEGIEDVRQLLPNCWFLRNTTKQLLVHMSNYQKKFSKSLGNFTDHPLHNRASHAADAFRVLAYATKQESRKGFTPQEMYAINNKRGMRTFKH